MDENKYATYSDKEISDAIEQGAITKEYLADPQRIISSLNRLRSTEITSYLQYKQHAYMAVSLLSPGLKGEFESHAEQELAHADRLAQRIQQLGPARVTSPSHVQDGFCVRRRPPRLPSLPMLNKSDSPLIGTSGEVDSLLNTSFLHQKALSRAVYQSSHSSIVHAFGYLDQRTQRISLRRSIYRPVPAVPFLVFFSFGVS